MDFLTKDSVSILQIKDGQNFRKAYVNSVQGRSELLMDCTQDIVDQVFEIWGDTPTVITDDRFDQGIDEITALQIAVVELASILV